MMENLSSEMYAETANAPVESFGAAAVATAETADGAIANDAATAQTYDADARQRQTFTIEENGAKFDTTHIFAPLADQRYFEYDKAAKKILADEGETGLSQTVEAGASLFDDLIEDIEGFDGEKPADWKALIDPVSEKLPSVNKLLVCAVVEADQPAEGGRRSWGGATESGVTLEVYFNGRETQTKHFLRKKTIEDGKAFERLLKMPLARSRKGLKSAGEIIMPSQAEGKAALYDLMRAKSAEGYAGRTPAHHKVAVIDYVFRSSLDAKK